MGRPRGSSVLAGVAGKAPKWLIHECEAVQRRMKFVVILAWKAQQQYRTCDCMALAWIQKFEPISPVSKPPAFWGPILERSSCRWSSKSTIQAHAPRARNLQIEYDGSFLMICSKLNSVAWPFPRSSAFSCTMPLDYQIQPEELASPKSTFLLLTERLTVAFWKIRVQRDQVFPPHLPNSGRNLQLERHQTRVPPVIPVLRTWKCLENPDW